MSRTVFVRWVLLPVMIGMISASTSCGPGAAPRQRSDRARATDESAVADRVRGEFRHAWRGYRRFAWGHDALRPLSRSHHDWYRESLLMTPVDALDTMLLMGLTEEARETRELIATRLSFNHDIFVRTFEVNIRMLGGLLSAYQLTGDQRLLGLAEDLGRRLLPAFGSATGMPYSFVNLRTGAVRQPVSNPAEVGTLVLELGTLSRLTGDPVYAARAMRALRAVHARRSSLGLVGGAIDVESGRWTDLASHVGGGIDSYYEYLYKCALLFDDPECARMWRESIGAVNRHLADPRAGGALWYRHASMVDGRLLATRFGALDCFFPGLLALSGDLRRAAALQGSCYQMWTRAGVIPEMIDYRTMAIVDGRYLLRPESIESTYYLYRATRDERYRRMGEEMLARLIQRCRTEVGYAALADVTSGRKLDEMESFFLAETMKYFYLLFARTDLLDLRQVVLNTEAHPLRKVRPSGGLAGGSLTAGERASGSRPAQPAEQ